MLVRSNTLVPNLKRSRVPSYWVLSEAKWPWAAETFVFGLEHVLDIGLKVVLDFLPDHPVWVPNGHL